MDCNLTIPTLALTSTENVTSINRTGFKEHTSNDTHPSPQRRRYTPSSTDADNEFTFTSQIRAVARQLFTWNRKRPYRLMTQGASDGRRPRLVCVDRWIWSTKYVYLRLFVQTETSLENINKIKGHTNLFVSNLFRAGLPLSPSALPVSLPHEDIVSIVVQFVDGQCYHTKRSTKSYPSSSSLESTSKSRSPACPSVCMQ